MFEEWTQNNAFAFHVTLDSYLFEHICLAINANVSYSVLSENSY